LAAAALKPAPMAASALGGLPHVIGWFHFHG